MKTIPTFALLAAVVLTTGALTAQPLPGPKGGRIVTAEAPHIEFLVGSDRAVIVSFYDRALQPVAPTTQVVQVTAETPAGKVKLAFAPKDGALVSGAPLPEGDGYTVVLQVRENADAKPRNYRVVFHDEICGGCRRAEYACICDAHSEEHGHKH